MRRGEGVGEIEGKVGFLEAFPVEAVVRFERS